MSALWLPAPLHRRIEASVRAMLQPQGSAPESFESPAWEQALVPPDSVSWQLFKNPTALFIGGVAAVILELAEPRVRTGVWEHTTFRERPVERLQRTALAAMMTVYGPRSRTEAMIASVVRRHEHIAGVTPAGEPYRASDPTLLRWVHATAAFGIAEATHAYVRPLARRERDRLYAEGRTAARLYGADGAPTSQDELDHFLAAMQRRLEPSDIVFDFLRILRHAPALPATARPLQGLLIRAAVDITPPWVRTRLGLDESHGLRSWQRPVVIALAQASDRLVMTSSPAVQACRRLGLPDDFLYDRSAPSPENARGPG
ncbi:oxygenase MpaB family protein [Piscinibacter sp. XHJ-5]|uniref:oxygenase MpaB family protein n=1 Tax=Piscinibacter sp. XHJ-5 TaxID=3037797 RepID=UPI002452F3AF|nr:oxygenase MpaB family protein [Piscinibacter sp. XHJ-5]